MINYFEPNGSGTRMRVVVEFDSPLGWLGTMVDRLFLARYIGGLIAKRNAVIKKEAESSGGA